MNPFEAFRFGAATAAPADAPLTSSPRKRPRPHTPVVACEATHNAAPAPPPAAAAWPPRRDAVAASLTSSSDAPPHWEEVLRRIRAVRAGRTASIDVFHAFLISLRTEPSPAFQALVAALLSVQCRDSVALAATRRLRDALGGAITPRGVADAAPGVVEDAVASCNMRNAKARFVRAAAADVLHRFNGQVPDDVSALESLPGVGPKIARLVASVAFGRTDGGIVVDTHVHRVAGRLGWAGPATGVAAADVHAALRRRTPERTRRALEGWLPAELWDDITLELIGFGQEVCTPLRPKCGACPLRELCPSAGGAQADAEGGGTAAEDDAEQHALDAG